VISENIFGKKYDGWTDGRLTQTAQMILPIRRGKKKIIQYMYWYVVKTKKNIQQKFVKSRYFL
jgi:hypothetical protein